MSHRTSFFPLSAMLLLCVAPGLRAQAPAIRPSVGVSGLLALDGLQKATHRSSGLAVDVAATLPLPGTRADGRLSLGFHDMPGSMHGTARTSLRNLQLAGDILLGTGKGRVLLGLSANRYTAWNEGHETFAYIPVVIQTLPTPKTEYNIVPVDCWEVTSEGARGVKLGLRLGYERTLADHWSLTALFQVTELSGGEFVPDASLSVPSGAQKYSRVNRGPVNPSWLQVGVRYHF